MDFKFTVCFTTYFIVDTIYYLLLINDLSQVAFTKYIMIFTE